MEQNPTAEMVPLSEVNIPEISKAMAFHQPCQLPPLHDLENPSNKVIENPLERSIKQRLGDLPNDQLPGGLLICRVPDKYRERNKRYFDPRLVSIGPYHHGRENLRAMENQKVRFLRDYLARCSRTNLEELIGKMKTHEIKARQSYSEIIELDGDQFVEMLLFDACFICEIIYRVVDDEIWSTKLGVLGSMVDILSDIFLIENQLPFFVLESLLDVSVIASFVGASNFLGLNQTQSTPPSCEIAHLVHLCYELNIPRERIPYKCNSKSLTVKFKQVFISIKSRFLSKSEQKKQNYNKDPFSVIPSASELCEAGIIFKRKESSILLDITFNKGIIEMPPILVDGCEQTNLANLLAFEQNKGDDDFLFLSSYLSFLMSIVRTSNDLAILRQCGIITFAGTNDEDNALFFNHLDCMITMGSGTNLFTELCGDIKDYYEGTWHRYRAMLKRDYFNSPWSIISLGAGCILLVLTFLQTLYGIKSYIHS
ncbi:hypothetical protein LUZ60_015375 [Juncus effusus]|nr:hypothetical protein LUZ60_015375 [Juncus effusus]